MGYILPITPYSYGNYHKRVMKQNNSTYHIGRKHPVTFQETLRDMDSESMSLSKFYMEENRLLSRESQRNHSQNKLTSGNFKKGQQVNITI